MFDYQAGERYRITLIMVAVAGFIAGIFIMILLAPPSEAPRKKRAMTRANYDPDVTGVPRGGGGGGGGGNPQQAVQPQAADAQAAKDFIRNFSYNAFDLSAQTASDSQAKAMQQMTPQCAQSYRASIWTPEMEQMVRESGVRATFQPQRVESGQATPDGGIVIFLTGSQTLTREDGASQNKEINVQYMVQRGGDGSLKVSGIEDR